ncbi:MAG: methyltransferase domain-containing protein [Acidobacteria bacterium]|nr:methyltransferase domain-containing protein [Acidobacteriota bacterium]
MQSPYKDARVAATYDRVAVPHHFVRPARDLIHMLGVVASWRVLDVGAGTGAATIPAVNSLGPTGSVVALEPSLEMLNVLRRKCTAMPVAGEVPGLPFAGGVFNAVFACFALSHTKSVELALTDMVRVLKPGGRLGVTSWSPNQTEASQLWRSIATKFVREETLAEGYRRFVPWEEWLSDPDRLRQALTQSGLQDVAVSRGDYPVSISVADFLAMREASVEGRLLAENLGPQQQAELKRHMIVAFETRFQRRLEFVREAFLACGTKRTS